MNALVERPPDPKESQSTRAWKIGAAGERRVAEILDATDCFVLHDRRIPGSKANIDHLAVGPAGVFVIDAKKYEDRQLELRDKGTFFSPDPRLYVGGRDQTKLVTGVKRQVDVVRSVLDGSDSHGARSHVLRGGDRRRQLRQPYAPSENRCSADIRTVTAVEYEDAMGTAERPWRHPRECGALPW